MKRKLFLLLSLSLSLSAGLLTHLAGLTPRQSVIISVFSMSIIGTLFFWDFRLNFVFLGSGVLFLIHAMDMETFMRFASLDVILFLIGMMILIAMMKEAGFFLWLVMVVLRIKNLDGKKMFIALMLMSSLLSGLMDEVSSILIILAVIFEICDFLEIRPEPLVISSILATNIGSASTVLGNPIGILIAARAGFTFEDFILRACPLAVIITVLTTLMLLFIYRDYIKDLSSRLKPYEENKGFLSLISIPPDRRTRISMFIFGITVLLIALHKRLGILLGIEENTLLIVLPIVSAGIVMIYRHDKARYYIEHEVEWNSLLFFMFLFAQAGVIRASGIADAVAGKLVTGNTTLLAGAVLFTSGILSSALDNVVVVASYVPVVRSLQTMQSNLKPLWWALLFGACYGGNITMIGSTANIVALGLLEKRMNVRITFFRWFRVGLVIGLVSMVIAYLAIIFIPIYSN